MPETPAGSPRRVLSVPRERAGERLDRFLQRELPAGADRVRALPGLPHRIDRDTTGCLLLARNDRALAALLGAFRIRVQLSEAGWPILGDAVYGTASPMLGRQALHAWRLGFPRPSDGARVDVEAPVPGDLLAAVKAMARTEP